MAGKSRILILRMSWIANHLFELVGITIYCAAVALKKFQSILDSFSRGWGMCYKGFPWSVPTVLLINSYFGDYRISTFVNKRKWSSCARAQFMDYEPHYTIFEKSFDTAICYFAQFQRL